MNVLIFIAGLLFYLSSGLWGFVYLAFATVFSYFLGRAAEKHRMLIWAGACVLGGVLLLMKLQGLLGLTLVSVLGISYFSLQMIAYLADIYRGKIAAERNFFRYALFMTYLPHLYIGPIEKYDGTLFERRRITAEGVWSGIARALWGGFKKLVIAARAGAVIGTISASPESYGGAYALAAMLLYSLQLYSDFSGGIDLVLGVSRILGVRLSENFDNPFASQSFQEFWRRWHITLGTWLKENVYIPLGGNRKGKVRKVINLLITFFVSGIWHGVEYILWGIINGIFVAFGTKLQTKWKTLNRVCTFLLVSLLWCFFIWSDPLVAMSKAVSVFTEFNYGAFFGSLGKLGLTLGDFIVLAVASAALCVYDNNRTTLAPRYTAASPWKKTVLIALLALVVLVFGMYGIGFNADAFIYSRF